MSYARKARYFFQKKEYEEVEKLLVNIEIPTIFYDIQVRALIIMTYFEIQQIQYDDLLNCRLNAFYTFVNNTGKLSKDYKEVVKNFINLTKKLKKNSEIHKRDRKTKLLEEDIKSSKVIHKAWLMKKVEEQF